LSQTARKIARKHFFLAAALLALCDSTAPGQWQTQTVDPKPDLRGLCVVSPGVAWSSGTAGAHARATDRGKTWSVATVHGAEKLDFRAVKAFGEATAYLLSAGPGDASRIYNKNEHMPALAPNGTESPGKPGTGMEDPPKPCKT
jgi:hypothetical protein